MVGLAAGNNLELLLEQTHKHRPSVISITDPEKARAAKNAMGNSAEVCCGAEGLIKLATLPAADIVLIAIVGTAGVAPGPAGVWAGGGHCRSCQGRLALGRGRGLAREPQAPLGR